MYVPVNNGLGRPAKPESLKLIRDRKAESVFLPDSLLAGVEYKLEDVLSTHGIRVNDITPVMSQNASDILAMKLGL
ncbi:hypothetical protein [Enterobacter hormaechei]|uniref:hypothetical protein n=1 Tax=Enterobacter hormaechei TaxID=158836 RepID=UPI003F41E039